MCNMVDSIPEEELKKHAPKTWEYMQFIRANLDIFENFEVIMAGSNFIITFDIVPTRSKKLDFRYPMELQLDFSEGTKPYWSSSKLGFSGLLYFPKIKKFGCYILDETITTK